MSVVVNDQLLASKLIAGRKASGDDRFDEVWNGVYFMSPMTDIEHQNLTSELTTVLRMLMDWNNLGTTLAGANISDQKEDWTSNYRVPDVLFFLNGTSAVDCGTHWHGGPDFVIEIVSSGDRTLDKLDFYASVNTRELLVIDRNPWKLTLYGLRDLALVPIAVSSFTQQAKIESNILPIHFWLDNNSSSLKLVDRTDGSLIREISIAL